jgi:hypothetical protein
MRFEKFGSTLVSVNLILYFGKPVTLVFIDFELDHSPAPLDRVHNLL